MRISSWRGLAATLTIALLASLGTAVAEERINDTISDVEVRNSDGTTQIVLRGAEEPIYTAFMREDPPGLVVELYDVTFEGLVSPLEVRDGNVEAIAFGAVGDGEIGAVLGRMTVGLSQDSDYEVIPTRDEVVVKVWPRNFEAGSFQSPGAELPAAPATESATDEMTDSLISAANEEAEIVPVAEVPAAPAVQETAEFSASAELAPAMAPASQVTNLESFENHLVVDASGPLGSVDSFVLDSPARLVVDLWGAENGLKLSKFAAGEGAIRQVRVGSHPEKVRIVVDLRQPIASHKVRPHDSGISIHVDPTPIESGALEQEPDDLLAEQGEMEPVSPAALGEMSASVDVDTESATPAIEEETQPVAVEPTAEMVEVREETSEVSPRKEANALPHSADAGVSASVSSVHFESTNGVERVVVATTGAPEPIMVQPDAVTVILDLPYTAIDPAAARRVDTREFGGTVEQVSAFRTPDVPIEQARVVVKHRGTSAPELTERNGQWTLEFVPRTSSLGAIGVLNPGETTVQSVARTTPRSEAISSYTQDVLGSEETVIGSAAEAPAAPAPALELDQSATLAASTALPASTSYRIEGESPAAIDLLSEGSYSAEKNYTGRRISLDFKDADIASILRLIAEVSDLNIVAGEEVKGEVTIRLVDVPWDQALDVVLLTKGLGFLRVGNVLRIAPIGVLLQEEESRLAERRAKEKLEDLVVKLQPVNYADVTEVEGLVARLLSDRGTVNVDRRTNTLIIKDIPSVIHEATSLVKAIDTQTPQVLIEAKIVEANLDFSRSLGAVWGLGYNPLGGQGGAPDFHLGDGSNNSLISSDVQATNFLVQNPVSSAIGTLTTGLLGLADRIQLDLSLQAAEANDRGKVISSPRVLTLDNTEATIQQGVAVAFESTTDNSINTNFVDAVLELKVTPHITADRSIVMKIKVSRNAPQLNTSGTDVVGITKNETETEALVMDGQTMVLGGIYVVDKSDNTNSVPYLADIPFLGSIFKGNENRDRRQELLIFVTPRVVNARAPAS